MSNKRHVYTAMGHEFQWVRRKAFELCADCAFGTPGPYSDLCEASTDSFDCKGETSGAWKEVSLGKQG